MERAIFHPDSPTAIQSKGNSVCFESGAQSHDYRLRLPRGPENELSQNLFRLVPAANTRRRDRRRLKVGSELIKITITATVGAVLHAATTRHRFLNGRFAGFALERRVGISRSAGEHVCCIEQRHAYPQFEACSGRNSPENRWSHFQIRNSATTQARRIVSESYLPEVWL